MTLFDDSPEDPPAPFTWWIPAGPYPLSVEHAAERHDAGRPVVFGTHADALAARDRAVGTEAPKP
jgi:hypothetical protein